MKQLLETIIREMVDEPEKVEVNEVSGQRSLILELTVAPGDLGKVIGRQGRNAQAIRTILKAAGGKKGVNCTLEINEDVIRKSLRVIN